MNGGQKFWPPFLFRRSALAHLITLAVYALSLFRHSRPSGTLALQALSPFRTHRVAIAISRVRSASLSGPEHFSRTPVRAGVSARPVSCCKVIDSKPLRAADSSLPRPPLRLPTQGSRLRLDTIYPVRKQNSQAGGKFVSRRTAGAIVIKWSNAWAHYLRLDNKRDAFHHLFAR